MEPTRELVDAARVGQVLGGVSLLCLLTSAALLGRSGGSEPLEGWGKRVAVGILLYPLWLLYNRIEDAFGLDSVAALLLNLALFAGLGAAGGWLLRRAGRSEAGLHTPEEE